MYDIIHTCTTHSHLNRISTQIPSRIRIGMYIVCIVFSLGELTRIWYFYQGPIYYSLLSSYLYNRNFIILIQSMILMKRFVRNSPKNTGGTFIIYLMLKSLEKVIFHIQSQYLFSSFYLPFRLVINIYVFSYTIIIYYLWRCFVHFFAILIYINNVCALVYTLTKKKTKREKKMNK